MTTITLRPAAAEDHAAIVDVFWACWTISYPTTLPAELIGRLDRAGADALWTDALNDPETTTVVAADGDTIVGVTRWSGDTVHSLYVHPASHGAGTGRRLLDHAAGAIAASGAGVAHLWVFAGNAPALAFYTRQGWSPDGPTRTVPAFGHLEHRLGKDVRRS